MKSTNIAKYFYEMGHLKIMRRSGWWRMGVRDPESVAEHSFRTAIIGYILASLEGVDPEKTASICLFHDTAEARITDLSWTAKRYISTKDGEQTALNEQTSQLPENIGSKILLLTSEYKDRSSKEAYLAHEADLLECLIQSREYANQGYAKGLEWALICREGLQTNTAKSLADACLENDPGDWFQNIQPNPHKSKTSQEGRLDFELALNEDLPSIHELVASVSGGYPHAVPKEVLKAWIRKNPQSIHVLRKGTEIVGYISIFPLPEETIIDRLSGKLFNRTIPIDDIQTFTPNATRLYIAEMAVKHSSEHIKQHEPDPNYPDPEARRLGLRLIREAGRFIAGLRMQNINISELYAVGTSRFGIQMSRDLGMQPMDLPAGTREDRVPFKMELNSKVSSIFVRKLIG